MFVGRIMQKLKNLVEGFSIIIRMNEATKEPDIGRADTQTTILYQ